MGIVVKPGHSVPAETATAARKIYNIQHIYLRIGDQLESVLAGIDLPRLDPSASLSGEATWRLALVTAFQYAEQLPDSLAEQATLKRLDWKYALRLPIQHPGISAAVLCPFRQNLFAFPTSAREFTRLLGALGQAGLFSRSASQALTAADVLAGVCNLTRLHWLNQGMRDALSALAAAAPQELREAALPHWYERYKKSEAVPANPESPAQEVNLLGADALRLLQHVQQRKIAGFNRLFEIENLSRLFKEHYQYLDGEIHWRMPGCLGCARVA